MNETKCPPDEIAMKSYFLGPRAENGEWFQERIDGFLRSWFDWRRATFRKDGSPIPTSDLRAPAFLQRQNDLAERANELRERFEAEIPKFSPRYVGHMFSELSLPALMGHVIALLHNPNNISAESSKVGLQIEKEAVAMLLRMAGAVPERGVGHFTSGGTVANFEALARARHRIRLWQALGAYARREGVAHLSLREASQMGWAKFDELGRRLSPSGFARWWAELQNEERPENRLEEIYGETWRAPAIILGPSSHYSWRKGAALLGFPAPAVIECELGREGRLDGASVRRALGRCADEGRPVAMIVGVAGTTELGSVDALDEIADEIESERAAGRFHWWHVDAAFGGFFASLRTSRPGDPLDARTLSALGALARANSLTMDPHKLGYVPYASGAFMCLDARDYPHSAVDAPYIAFENSVDPGVYSLEGSRSATGAAATWLAGRTMGFDEKGHGRVLKRATQARRRLEGILRESAGVYVPGGLDLNVLCFSMGRARRLSVMNQDVPSFIRWIESLGESAFQVSRTTIARKSSTESLFQDLIARGFDVDADEIRLVRLCLMNPFLSSEELRTDLIAEFAARVDEFLRPGRGADALT